MRPPSSRPARAAAPRRSRRRGAAPNQPYLVPVTDRYDGAGGLNPNHTWTTQAVLAVRPGARRWACPAASRSLDHDHRPGLAAGAVGGASTPSERHARRWRRRPGRRSTLGLRSTCFRLLQVTLDRAGDRRSTGTPSRSPAQVWPDGPAGRRHARAPRCDAGSTAWQAPRRPCAVRRASGLRSR